MDVKERLPLGIHSPGWQYIPVFTPSKLDFPTEQATTEMKVLFAGHVTESTWGGTTTGNTSSAAHCLSWMMTTICALIVPTYCQRKLMQANQQKPRH
jgi:hypothetical protein